MALEYNLLKVTDITPTAQDAVCITFGLPENIKAKYTFDAGQHLTFNHMVNGKTRRRFYSICSPSQNDELRIGVRQIEDGRFSKHLNCDLRIGDELEVLAPRGRFCLNAAAAGKHILLFAAGSGITPVYAILSAHLASHPHATATLVFGNRNTKTIMLRNDIDDLKDHYIDRFQLIHVLSREQQDVDLLNGRIDSEFINKLVGASLIDPKSAAQIFICGPGDMIDNVRGALLKIKVDEKTITTEQFTALAGKKEISPLIQKNIKSGVNIIYILDGVEKQFSLDDPKGTVLTGAQEAGHDLPFSCAGGMCATCRCRLVEGEVEMAVNYALEPWELETGFVLACQSRPKTKNIRLDFDAT